MLVLVRGDHRVNEIKLANALGAPFRPAGDEEIRERIGPPGYIGPVGADVHVLLDDAVADGGYVVGANEPDHHLRGVEPGRDFAFERADVRSVEAGDTVDGNPITIEPAIEVGNIFKLGTRFSDPLGATYLDEGGKEQLIWMGSYGIGPARIAAAAVEQYGDEKGIAWPKALAPWDIEVVALGKAGIRRARRRRSASTTSCRAAGLRGAARRPRRRPGRQVRRRRAARLPAAADGRPAVAEGRRRGGADPPRPADVEGGVPLDGVVDAVAELWPTIP